MPAVLNAANEVAVEVFLAGKISFTAIPAIIRHVMQSVDRQEVTDLDDVIQADSLARETARKWLADNQVRKNGRLDTSAISG